MNSNQKIFFFLFLFTTVKFLGQNLSLYQQFNGRYSYTMIGNTHNPQENSFQATAQTILTTTNATLTLTPQDQVEKAFLYWAGCGTGDFEVQLNSNPVTAQRTFSTSLFGSYNFFSAFADVTSLIQSTGSGIYTLSELDVNSFLDFHYGNRTNFAGWALIVVYKNNSLPLNQLNVYDGLQFVSSQQQSLTINLNTLNVVDTQGSNIGFLAWEGDSGLAVNETLRINNNILSNIPLNPANNAFNGTNSFTGSNTLYNMDLDVYEIQNYINIGDTTAQITLTSGQDFVMINAVVTKLNSQLPDATSVINSIEKQCDSREIKVNYTIANNNSTAILPIQTPISFFANNTLLQTIYTTQSIPIDGNISGIKTLTIPSSIPNNFILTIHADNNGTTGVVIEINENNNTDTENISLNLSPTFNLIQNLSACNQGFTKAIFNLEPIINQVKTVTTDIVSFHTSQQDAISNSNAISNLNSYEPPFTPFTIFIRISNVNCYSITSFQLLTKNCAPTIYNYVTANNDGSNDFFFIDGLRNIFLNFQLQIYNRWGNLVWEGNQNTSDWRGENTVKNTLSGNIVPDGTYYYILNLNDTDYPDSYVGYVYFTQ